MTSGQRISFKHQRVSYLLLAAIVVLTLVFACHLLLSEGSVEPPNVLLITIDALRADRLGCYGYRLDTSPNIDRLSQRGVLFADCTVQWPKTWPSMASLISGMYPKATGVRINQRVLPSSLYVMSEIFGQAGYRTGAVTANFNIGRKFGFDRGFDYFVESWQDMWKQQEGDIPFHNRPGKVKFFTNATIVTDQALKWLNENRKNPKPFFLWLHYMDTHGPYVPPQSYDKYFQNAYKSEPAPLRKLPPYQLHKDTETGHTITDIGFYRAKYDREIRFLDDELGRLFKKIRKLGANRKTIIIFTADHGESFGEHNYYLEHGRFPYQACAHVPLIIIKDGILPKGKRIEKPVGLIDVSATILELAGIEVPATFEGQSLVGMMLGEKNATAPEYVFMESGYDPNFPQLTVRYGRWKLIHVQSQSDLAAMAGTKHELYDVYKDSAEVNNLIDQEPNIAAHLSEVLHKWYASGPRYEEKGTETKIDIETFDPKVIEMLKSLGYVK